MTYTKSEIEVVIPLVRKGYELGEVSSVDEVYFRHDSLVP